MREAVLLRFFLCLLYLATNIALAKAPPAPAPKELPAPDQTLETVFPSIAAAALAPTSNGGKQLVLLPTSKSFLIFNEYPIISTQNEKITERFKHMTKKKLPFKNKPSFVGVVPIEKGYLLLNGEDLTMHFLDLNLELISSHSVVYDRILPARDRGGEAASWEIGELRVKFKKNYEATTISERLAGIAPIPEAWLGDAKHRTYVVLSRIPKFPVMIVTCDPTNPSQCEISRQCFVESTKLDPGSLSGIAVNVKTKTLLIGDPKQKRLLSLYFESCFNVVDGGEYLLPKKMKTLRGIYIASEGLVLTTDEPDDYNNASAYFWSAF